MWLPAVDGPYTSCSAWTRNVLEWLTADPPDVVIATTSGLYNAVHNGAEVSRDESRPLLARGLSEAWNQLDAAGSRVVMLLDTPRANFDLPECIAENDASLTACAYPRTGGVARSAAAIQLAAAEDADVDVIDLTDYICPGPRCAPVIGGVMVMRDSHHLTATYALTLAPVLGMELAQVVPVPRQD